MEVQRRPSSSPQLAGKGSPKKVRQAETFAESVPVIPQIRQASCPHALNALMHACRSFGSWRSVGVEKLPGKPTGPDSRGAAWLKKPATTCSYPQALPSHEAIKPGSTRAARISTWNDEIGTARPR